MPNHVQHALTVLGPAEDVAAFVVKANAPVQQSGDEPGSFNYMKNVRVSPLSFHAIVPLPDEYSKVPYSHAGYYMESDTWGVKWGAYNEELPEIVNGNATYKFTCAWGVPHAFFEKASVSWPSLKFCVSFGGEGPVRGRRTYQNGECTVLAQDEDGPEYPKYRDDMTDAEEDAHYFTYKDAERYYINTHKEWIASL